jgi:hypothetical protein
LAAGLASGGLQRKDGMAKEELIELEGLVTEILPAFRVQLDSGHAIVADTAGRMKKNRIDTLGGRPRDGRNVAL